MTDTNQQVSPFMLEAIELARLSVSRGSGPFGAVIVCDGEIVGRGHNRVPLSLDPTAHAEMEAIRDACRQRGHFHLHDCVLYTSCMPCPMCLSASYWARISHIYYAASAEDAAAVGFDDHYILTELQKPTPERSLPLSQMQQQRAQAVFQEWWISEGRIDY